MFKRELESELKELAKGYPIVTVIGPRQSGKTTIVQQAFPKKMYANLEFPDKGGYPRIYKEQLDPTKLYRSYFQTYVERDLRQLIQVKDLMQFERFIIF